MCVCVHTHAQIAENVKPPKLAPVWGWEYLWVDAGRRGAEHLFSASYVALTLNDKFCSPFPLLSLHINQFLRSTRSGKDCLDPCSDWSHTPLGRVKIQAMTREVSSYCSRFGYPVIQLLVWCVQGAVHLKTLARFVSKGSLQNEAIGKWQLSLQWRNKGLFCQDLIRERKQAGPRSQILFSTEPAPETATKNIFQHGGAHFQHPKQ